MDGMGGGSLPRISVPQLLRQPKPRKDYFGTALRGFVTGNEIGRQRALDAMARQKMVDDDLFRRTVEDRQAKQAEEAAKLQRDQAADLARTRDETIATGQFNRRKGNIDLALSGFDGFQKDAEVASATAPFYDEAKGYAEMLPGESMDDPVFRSTVSGLVGKAKGEADKVYSRKAELDKEKARIAGDRVAMTGRRMEMLTPAQTKEVTGIENTIRNVDRLDSKIRELDASGKYPGLYGMKVNQAAKYLEGQDVDATVLNAMITGTIADYIFQVSGKAVTEQEFARLRNVTANQDDTVQSAVGKLKAFRTFMADRKEDTLRGYELSDKNVNPGWRASDYSGKPAAGTSAPAAVPSTFKPRGK
jgi:hypothetical protein